MHPAGAPTSPATRPRRPGANKRLLSAPSLPLPWGSRWECGETRAWLQPPRAQPRCEPGEPPVRLRPLRALLNPPAASSRTIPIPLQPPLFCPFARFSRRFLFPVFSCPACPALLPHPNSTALLASLPPRSPQRTPLLRAPPSCPISPLIPPRIPISSLLSAGGHRANSAGSAGRRAG